MIETFEVLKIKGGNKEAVEDFVVQEIPLTLVVNGKELVTILCCPADLEDLARGFLFTSGLIKSVEGLKKIIVDRQSWTVHIDLADTERSKDLIFKRLYTSGCGRGTMFYSVSDLVHRAKIVSDFRIEPAKISSLLLDFQRKSEVYLKTGGIHSAALTDDKNILIFKEDIGRHNALDKVIGARLQGKGSFSNKIMITSGRISSEVLLKIQKCKIPLIISKSAPTNQAIKLAREMNITLVGFARGSRMNVYSGEERVR